MTTELPTSPADREELYLAGIAGEGVELPDEPKSRKEQYLAYIAENGGGGGGGGTTNYNALNNKPKIAGTTLQGDKSASDLGLATSADVSTLEGQISAKVSDVKVNGVSVTTSGTANVTTVQNLTSALSTDPLAANQGKLLQDQVTNLQNIGRFLAIWNATTGVPTSEPTVQPYNYRTGDYYRVGTAGTRIPTGSEYVIGGTNYVEGDECAIGDVFYYDGTNWNKQASGGGGTVQDVQVNGVSVLSGGIANVPVPTVTQSTGTSTTDVMSQKAVTEMVFNQARTGQINIGGDKATSNKNYSIVIGNEANATGDTSGIAIGGGNSSMNAAKAGNWRSIAIGSGASCNSYVGVSIGSDSRITGTYNGAISIGANSGGNITAAGMMDIGSTSTSYGYNSSNYRLLTGLYDPQNDHDAATKGYVDSHSGGDAIYSTKTTSSTATGGAVYIGDKNASQEVQADPTTVDNHYKYFWALPQYSDEAPASGSVNIMGRIVNSSRSVVIGDSAISAGGTFALGQSVAIGASSRAGNGKDYITAIGGFASVFPEGGVAVGRSAAINNADHSGSIAIGASSGSGITAAGMMDIGTSNTSYGYSTSNYRLLTGLYDGQSAHDAATVGQLNALIDAINAAANTNIAHIGS